MGFKALVEQKEAKAEVGFGGTELPKEGRTRISDAVQSLTSANYVKLTHGD